MEFLDVCYHGLLAAIVNAKIFQFGQRSIVKKSQLVTDLKTLHKVLSDETRTVDNILSMTKETLLVTTSPAETEFEETAPNTNLPIADFTTAQARLHLYSYMEELGDRVLYTDTGKHPFVWKIY